jgi:hypothetical protein
MSFVPSFKAIIFGSSVILAGYLLCMLFISALYSLSAPQWSWVVLGLFAVLLAAFSGFVGALFARSSPLVNGTLAGFVGAAVLLGILVAVTPAEAHMVFIGPLPTVGVLAFCGALVAVYAWPRRGL